MRTLTRGRTWVVPPMFDSVERACASLATAARIVEQGLSGAPAVTLARNTVTAACRRWGIGELADVAEVVVGELVSNAVLHTDGRFDLDVGRYGRHLRLAVRDGSPALPRLGEGFGLRVVEALARTWGCVEVPGGKVVWSLVAAGSGNPAWRPWPA